MALHWKLVVDCSDPLKLADFWAAALGYTVEDHSALIERLIGIGAVTDRDWTEAGGRKVWRAAAAVRHPDDETDPATGIGLGRRVLFKAVPEPKQLKNRLHIDVHAAPGQRSEEAERLTGLGATVLHAVEEPGSSHLVMTDPEGNEFCLC